MEKALWPPKAERATVIRNNELVVPKDGNLRSERCPHEDSLRLNIIHTVYIDIYILITIIIVLIKNYYVNSYLTTCMAQSIKLVSCNNNNKDTTIYLLVSLSSFDSHRLLLCSNLLVYTSFFFFLLFPHRFLCLRSPCYYMSPCIRLCTQFCSLTIEKIGNFRYRSASITFSSVLYHCNI